MQSGLSKKYASTINLLYAIEYAIYFSILNVYFTKIKEKPMLPVKAHSASFAQKHTDEIILKILNKISMDSEYCAIQQKRMLFDRKNCEKLTNVH